jgi:hypothetical protein
VQRHSCLAAFLPALGHVCGLVALLCGTPIAGLTDPVQASDLQRSTDIAAAGAKKALRIALNQGRDTSKLQERFFEFYEGKIVSAPRLHPETFARGQIGPLPPFTVLQVLGLNEMLVSVDSEVFKLRDVATAEVADDQTMQPSYFFFVHTTETYNTVRGVTKTVYVLEPAKSRVPSVNPTWIYPWYARKDEVVVVGEFKVIDGTNAVFDVRRQQSSVPLTKFTRGDRDLTRLIMSRYPHEKRHTKSQATPAAPTVGID